MANYSYKARNTSGELIEGIINSYSEKDAALELERRKLVPIEIKEQGRTSWIFSLFFDAKKVSLKDLSVFFRQLASLVSSGVPLFESLSAILEQVPNRALKDVVKVILSDIEAGNSFSQSLSNRPDVFSKLIVSMVEVGERGGDLSGVLLRVSVYLEKENSFRNKMYSALRYPMTVLFVLAVAFVFAVIFIIPRFISVFSAFNADLPLPTKILIWLNAFIVNYWLWLVLLFFGLYVVFRWYFRTSFGEYQRDLIFLRLPVVGTLFKKIALSRFFGMLSLMLQSGIPIVEALEVTAGTADNVVLSNSISEIRKEILNGGVFSDSMRKFSFFPSTAVNMVAIGEKSGNLSEMLLKVSDYFNEDADYMVSNLLPLLEPLLIFVLAILVATLALGIFLPMWSLIGVQTAP